MKKIYLLILLIVILFFQMYNDSFSQVDQKDAIMNKIIEMKEKAHLKAVIAGVWKGDKEILTTALGESMTLVPATTDMHLRTGGISETMMGTLVMILVDQGKIKLEDKLSKWLPDLLAADSVTIDMLIKNTTGYKDYVLNEDFINLVTKEPFRYISEEEIINYSVRSGQLNFRPGLKFEYSHTNFTILGEAIEKATGKEMNELLEENIFRPLGLQNTGYNRQTADLPYPVLHAYSSQRDIYEDASFYSPSWVGESGPIYSNLQDLAKWSLAFGKGKLLSPAGFQNLISNPVGSSDEPVYFASGFLVAYGWYAQNPSFNGYSGAFGYFPPEEYTIIVFSTESDGFRDTRALPVLQEITKILTPQNDLNKLKF